MSNIKEVIINPNKPADVKFVQYDTGQKLYVKNSPDFDFTNTTEIQITDGTESAARYRFEPYGDGGIVELPDTMFRNAGILKGYIFSVDPHGHTTEALISIGIRERPVYNEYISDASEEVVIPAGFEVIQNPESVTIKAYNTDGTVTEGTVENGSDGEPGVPGERGSDGISPEASIEQTATGAIITVKDARGTTTATLENGHDGNDGISPTAKVEQTAGGAKVTITDKNGTTVANLTNGQPGQPGSRGQDGTSPSINIDTIEGGHRLTITDESHGTQYVDVMDGERGRQGDPGERGPRGYSGADGVSPEAKVEQTETGATVTVTDAHGTTTANLTNGRDGRDGQDGQDGVSPEASVEQTADGAVVTVTDAHGTTTATLTNGRDGETGPSGADGFSPSASVEQLENGAKISITDEHGTTEATIHDGSIGPQGLPGVNGVSPSIVIDDIPGGHRLTIYDDQHHYQYVDVLDGHTIGVPFGGQTGQVLKKISNADFDTEWADEEGGVVDYPDLTNKPSINGVTLVGNKTAEDLGLGEIVELTQAEYDALTEIDPDTAYFINDADPAALGTAAFKDYTDLVRPGSRALVESNAVYSAINNALSSIYTPRGNIDCADLTSSLLVDANVGNVYETNDSGTTTALFMQGAGKTINAGDNVGIVKAGQNLILFNLMGNAFDLTNYQKKTLATPAEGQSTVEGAIGALATNKQEKTLTTPVESRTTVETALEALSSVKQPKTLTTAVESETTVEDALGALSDNKAAKSEMSVTDGTGADADKTTIQLKSGTSATVLKTHQDISGKADKVTGATANDIATLDANGNLVDSGISKNGFVKTGVIQTSSGDGYKKVEITTSEAYLNGRFYLKDRRGNEYVIMIASGYPTAFYRLARVSAVREYIVEVRQTRGHNGRLNVFIHSLDFDTIGYTFIGCDNVTVTVSDSDATEFATGTAIIWQKFVTNSDLNDYMWQNRTRTNDVLADALNISTPTILEGSGTAYTGTVPYSALKYAIFLVIPRGGDRFVIGWINGAIAVNNYNSTTWNGWSLHEAPTSSVTSGGTAPVTSGGVYNAIQNPAKWKGLVITESTDTKATFFQKIVNTFGACNSGDWITIADNANKFGYAAGIMVCRSDRLQGMLVPHWTTSGARIYFINCRKETAQDATLRYVDLTGTTEVTF